MTKIPWHKLIPKQLTIGVVGAKRMGKTYYMGRVIFPELVNRGIPFIAMDMVGGLVEHAIELNTAFVIEVDKWVQPGMPGWLHVQNIVLKSWKKKQGILFDCGGLLQEQKADFVNALSRFIWTHKKDFKKGCIIIDEAHEVLPERRGRYAPEFERLLRQGGNHELAFVISTQRPASISKMVWYLCDIFVVFRVTYAPDVEPIEAVIKRAQTKEETDALMYKIAKMGVGEQITIIWTEI